MSQMVERVTQALKEEIGNIPRERIERAAIKASRAMREPGVEMMVGGAPQSAYWGEVWRAIIDSALSDHPLPPLRESAKPSFRKGMA
jgi:hypothetical protein